jgi:pantoate--beta-alanine ligase
VSSLQRSTRSTDMEIIASVREMSSMAWAARAAGKTISFVPTMGFLHEGHASLLREGRQRGDLLVLSIFVNPAQFGAGEDFDSYPRDLTRDAELARENGVDILFVPSAAEMYPSGYQTWVDVEDLTRPMCGTSRPGHFRGVSTVVTKLLNIVKPTRAFFGEKDYQQLAVIRRMVADMNMDVEITGMPTVRESDGLAMSSRNNYLTADERRSALCLSRSLAAVSGLYRAGERSAELLLRRAMEIIAGEPAAVVDYVEFRDGDSLLESPTAHDGMVMALAVKIGKTRLIDNMILGRGYPCGERC